MTFVKSLKNKLTEMLIVLRADTIARTNVIVTDICGCVLGKSMDIECCCIVLLQFSPHVNDEE